MGSSKANCVGHHELRATQLLKLTVTRSNIRKDSSGTEHLVMHFNMEGPRDKGVVSLHMTKRPSQDEFEYKYLALDVPGHSRIYLENADSAANSLGKGVTKLFGVQWTR